MPWALFQQLTSNQRQLDAPQDLVQVEVGEVELPLESLLVDGKLVELLVDLAFKLVTPLTLFGGRHGLSRLWR